MKSRSERHRTGCPAPSPLTRLFREKTESTVRARCSPIPRRKRARLATRVVRASWRACNETATIRALKNSPPARAPARLELRSRAIFPFVFPRHVTSPRVRDGQDR